MSEGSKEQGSGAVSIESIADENQRDGLNLPEPSKLSDEEKQVTYFIQYCVGLLSARDSS